MKNLQFRLKEKDYLEYRSLKCIADLEQDKRKVYPKVFALAMQYKLDSRNKFSLAQIGMGRLKQIAARGLLISVKTKKKWRNNMYIRYSFTLSELGIHKLFHYECGIYDDYIQHKSKELTDGAETTNVQRCNGR